MKTALITGANGQDGSYLSELLLEQGYDVHGTIRRASTFNVERILHLMDDPKLKNRFHIHYGDVTDAHNMFELIRKVQPDEVYNLSAQSHVQISFELPSFTLDVDGRGTLNLLEAIRQIKPNCKLYQASTSELYGGMGYNMPATGYNEESAMHPRSPYGCAKMYSLWITRNYREAYKIPTANGILFNHESPRRGFNFVSKKITEAVARIAWKKQSCVVLGNLDAKRDWGHAKDFVRAMHLMLQPEGELQDYVVATNEVHSVREFVDNAFRHINIDITWEGKGVDEIGRAQDGRILVRVDPKYFRPSEVALLKGDCSKITRELGWRPLIKFDELVDMMMAYDLEKHKG